MWTLNRTINLEAGSIMICVSDKTGVEEVTLILTRSIVGTEAQIVDAKPYWNGNGYTYDNLDRTDAYGNVYTYSVQEKPIEGFSVSAKSNRTEGTDFINTHVGITTLTGTKIWLDKEETHNNADEVTLGIFRISAKSGAQPERYAATPEWSGNTYIYRNLPAYDREGYAYTYYVTEGKIKGYTTSYTNESGETDAAYQNGTIVNTMITDRARRDSLVIVNKVDKEGTMLKGAKFTLYNGDDAIAVYSGGDFRITTADTVLQPILPAVGETPVVLTLKETQAPTGYRVSGDKYIVLIGAGETSSWNDDHTAYVTVTEYRIVINGGSSINVVNISEEPDNPVTPVNPVVPIIPGSDGNGVTLPGIDDFEMPLGIGSVTFNLGECFE